MNKRLWQIIILLTSILLNISPSFAADTEEGQKFTNHLKQTGLLLLQNKDAGLSEADKTKINQALKEAYPKLNDFQLDYVRKALLYFTNINSVVSANLPDLIQEFQDSAEGKSFLASLSNISANSDLNSDSNKSIPGVGNWVKTPESKVRIISSNLGIPIETELLASFNFNLEANWFLIYDSLNVDFSHSTNATFSPLFYLTPVPLANKWLGYKDLTQVLFKINALDKLEAVNIKAKLSYRICSLEQGCKTQTAEPELTIENKRIEASAAEVPLKKLYRQTPDSKHYRFEIEKIYAQTPTRLTLLLKTNGDTAPIQTYITNLDLIDYEPPKVTFFGTYALVNIDVKNQQILGKELKLWISQDDYSATATISPQIETLNKNLTPNSFIFNIILLTFGLSLATILYALAPKLKDKKKLVIIIIYFIAFILSLLLLKYSFLYFTRDLLKNESAFKIESLKDTPKTLVIAPSNNSLSSRINDILVFKNQSLRNLLANNHYKITYVFDKDLKQKLKSEYNLRVDYFVLIYNISGTNIIALNGYQTLPKIKKILKRLASDF